MQRWANWGPGATCGLMNYLIRPAEPRNQFSKSQMKIVVECESFFLFLLLWRIQPVTQWGCWMWITTCVFMIVSCLFNRWHLNIWSLWGAVAVALLTLTSWLEWRTCQPSSSSRSKTQFGPSGKITAHPGIKSFIYRLSFLCLVICSVFHPPTPAASLLSVVSTRSFMADC